MAKPALIAKLTCLDGKRDDAIANFQQMFDHIATGEPGTEVYVLHEDADDPNVIYFYELYRDDAALATHGGSDTMKAVGRGLKGLLAGAPELIKLSPRMAKGVDL
ncbi:MAG: antibiotic biosynthesis monooxygenase [Acidimicrobiia bacterium]|nr:antibiotic biosynthesis monooxygenase [Acidimicrobiia bacterium]